MHHFRPLRIGLIFFLVLPFFVVEAQEKCMTHQLRPLDHAFEKWMRTNLIRSSDARNTRDYEYVIPVVVHIVHKGETIGTGSNLSENQVLSQIKVLNNDFQRLNADTAQTPQSFSSVAGRIRIQFVLAKQDPDGKATSGITRTRGSNNIWYLEDEVLLKQQNYWPAEDYLNVWVADLGDPILGYAQFPVSSLPGLDFAFDDRETDGIALDYLAFGSSDGGTFNLYSSSTKGRTTTHEVGHFLGLRHIWGDDDSACGAPGDYVDDTPDQSGPSNGCPMHPSTSCGNPKMFQNYMDYTNDRCMNIFTSGQIDRMLTVLENSKRRQSLTVSHGLNLPDPVPNDITLLTITSPRLHECSPDIVPTINVRNAGSNEITSFEISYLVDNFAGTKTFSTNLAAGASMTAEFPLENLTSGTHTVEFVVSSVNNSTDPTFLGNKVLTTFNIESQSSFPFLETFNTLPSTWTTTDPDEKVRWLSTEAPREKPQNKALYLNYHGSGSINKTDTLISPVINGVGNNAVLLFDIAYAVRMDQGDRLKVLLLKDCSPRSQAIEVFNKSGNDMATARPTINEFVPANLTEWRREAIDLSGFDITSSVQIIFVGVSNGGNNLYLDNVRVVTAPDTDLSLLSVSKPYPVQCSDQVTARLKVKNAGSEPIHSFQVKFMLNDFISGNMLIDGFVPIGPGDEVDIDLDPITMPESMNIISFELAEPNNVVDLNEEDNAATRYIAVDTTTDIIPLRENFESGGMPSAWVNVNTSIGPTWELTTIEGNTALRVAGLPDTGPEEIWFASPILDLSTVVEASVFFDYATLQLETNAEEPDTLLVCVSRDCGKTYEVIHNVPVITLSANQWQTEKVILSQFAGEADLLVALVAKKHSKHDLLIDNLEFYVEEDPARDLADLPYALYGNDLLNEDVFITFKLNDRQDVSCEMVDVAGRNVFGHTFNNVLNQTYRLEFPSMARGLYVVRVRVGERYYTTRIVL
jgi:hypothetical protein